MRRIMRERAEVGVGLSAGPPNPSATATYSFRGWVCVAPLAPARPPHAHPRNAPRPHERVAAGQPASTTTIPTESLNRWAWVVYEFSSWPQLKLKGESGPEKRGQRVSRGTFASCQRPCWMPPWMKIANLPWPGISMGVAVYEML